MNQSFVLITGASGTIGQAAAAILNEKGHNLILADKNKDSLAELSKKFNNCQTHNVDATNAKQMEELFNLISSKVTSVVLAVGIEGPIGSFEDCKFEDFQEVMNINVNSTWLGIKNALRILKKKQHGNIIALSSISGVMGMPMLSPYCASKHAVMGLVRSAAREAAAFGIRINAVCPGPVSSEMMNRIDSHLDLISPSRTKAPGSVPMQRYASPAEVAKMIAFLCSEESTYCIGTAMMVDGGITCR